MAKGYFTTGSTNLESFHATASLTRSNRPRVLPSTASQPAESTYSFHKPQHPSTAHPIALGSGLGVRVWVRVVSFRHHGQNPRQDSLTRLEPRLPKVGQHFFTFHGGGVLSCHLSHLPPRTIVVQTDRFSLSFTSRNQPQEHDSASFVIPPTGHTPLPPSRGPALSTRQGQRQSGAELTPVQRHPRGQA